MKKHKVDSYTLNEALLVLAIIGCLILLVYPNFMPLITRTKAQEAKIQLNFISTLQTQHRYVNSTYSSELNEIQFYAPRTVLDGGNANYSYSIISSNNISFKARAEAVVDFDGDGVFNVWEIDENNKPVEVIQD